MKMFYTTLSIFAKVGLLVALIASEGDTGLIITCVAFAVVILEKHE